MGSIVLLVTGCDSGFFPFMLEGLESLVAVHVEQKADIAVLDLGLTSEQVSILSAMGCTVRVPYWTIDVPDHFRGQHQIGLVARTALREYFPGYSIYLWFDADAWAQTPEFFDRLVDGARDTGAGVTMEDGANYRRAFSYTKWWLGNMMAAYGPLSGLRIGLKPVINIGILALSDTAPHWNAWIRYYKEFISRRGRVNNQHSFNAMVQLDRLPYAPVSARCNWICTLSDPIWNPSTRQMCEPTREARPLSVVHLAGPDKRRIYRLKTTSGGQVDSELTYSAVKALQQT